MKFTVYQNSRQGPRPYNQDRLAYSYSKDALLLVIADGMGGHRHGELAAQLAVKTLTDAFQTLATPMLMDPVRFLTDHILLTHQAIDQLMVAQDLLESPRTTIVAAIVQENVLYCAHVGDSRLYLFRNRRLQFRTEDHSLVQMLFRKGQISQPEMLTHPERHKIYNCLGGSVTPQIELAPEQNMQPGDILLLCTDGVWSALSDQEINEVLHEGPITSTVPNMLNYAESASGKDGDNASAIGLQWGERAEDHSLAVSTVTMPLHATTTIINPLTHQPRDGDTPPVADLTDDEIEKAIAEIQGALRKTQRS